ncbi:cytidine and deoxycytidylate deaminase zinc-binding region protein (macronuclear) [Tetrahymena thermophila SB210]|uniref:dCMP deaminase n=1 Tax=Tetrahymena thermophila (strain SB210) TaxID=312017 RepID=I7MN23_TETTS|nr:cytidine and deoxycytidylate deaminase zinc-binding region protein [Tetrahymena thermophila SB210]EAS07764.2 cytidine and deoxycytidylate deaminase zinc-binding region protein [Tetrahymena thermophila SB210]|eukprot:XP_001028006.2 cytidine and deoxycytidylate deaminase zinc-binding region protein [Tetrahymena thermophila SB210]
MAEKNNKKQFQIIIGLVGKICSGKTTFCELITKRGLRCIKGDDIPLENLIQLIVKLRKQGATQQELKQILMEEINTIKANLKNQYEKRCKKLLEEWTLPTIISRIYTNNEVQFLSKRNFFHKIYLDCPLLTRFENFKNKYNKYSGDIDLNMFCLLDDCVNYGLNIQGIIQEFKVTVSNEGSVDDLDNYISKNEKKILREYKPSWDEYFMRLAVEVKKRSNCNKRSVGAILISKEKRILSTGYNGTPLRMKDCFYGGCERCNQNTAQGQGLDQCWCIHAEENCLLDIGVRESKQFEPTMYTTLFPCRMCAKVIIQSGVTRIVYMEDFDSNKSKDIIDEYNNQNPSHMLILQKLSLDDYVY